jgi:hypothetical protein
MVKDYIQDYPDCIHKNHPLRDQFAYDPQNPGDFE